MNICITPNSIKLFGSYISRKLPEYLTSEKTAEALLNDLFNDALVVFNDNGMTKSRNKELILQHMSIVPQITLKYIADNPKIGSPASFDKLKELAAEVINATEDSSKTAFQGVIDRFGGFIGNNTMIVPEGNPLDRFEAVSFALLKTNNQEAIYNPLLGYSENITDPAKVFEFQVARNIIKNGNKSSLSFRFTTLREFENNPKFVNTTGSTDLNFPILVLVNSKNELVAFTETGEITTPGIGNIPAYTIKTDKRSLEYQLKMLTKLEMAYNNVFSETEAKAKAQAQINSFLDYINQSIAKVQQGDVIYMNIDLMGSSLGFIAQDRYNTTPLTEISNLNSEGATLEQGGNTGQFFPVIAPANTNRTFRVFEKPLSSLTDEEFETLHYLISKDVLKIKGYTQANANASGVREEFMNFFIDSYEAGNFHYYVEESVVNGKKVKTRMVRMGYSKPIVASKLTLQQLKDFANERYARPVSANEINAEESNPRFSEKEVTNLGEYFYGNNGKVFESVGPRRSFRNKKSATMDSIIYKVPAKIENGELQTGERLTLGEHIRNVGYTNLVPTADGKLQGFGAYLAFTPSIEIAKSEVEQGVKGLEFAFKDSEELETIGSLKEYSEYLATIFPESLIKQIVYRGSTSKTTPEAEDLDPKKGTGVKNLGVGIYWAKEFEKASRYAINGGKVTAAIVNVPNFAITSIDKNWSRGYDTPSNVSVNEVTQGKSNTLINFEYLDRDAYITNDNNKYIGDYTGPVDENGFPAYQKEISAMPFWSELAVNDNDQLHILGSKKDVDGFKKFMEQKTGAKPKSSRQIKWRSVSERNSASVTTTEQNEAALTWWNNSPLSKAVKLNNMQNKASEFGPAFVANFLGNAINLYQGSSSTDIYHEAFHAFFDGILTASERKEIYDTLRNTPGYFTTVVNGQTKVVSYSSAEDIELEELLAEAFRDYALSNGKKTNFSNNKIVAFFQKLLNLLKSVFGNMTYAEAKAFNKTQSMTDVMFSDLFKGEFTADMFVASDEQAKWHSTEVKTTTGDEFTLEEMHDTMTSMKSIMSDFITRGLNFSQSKSDQEKAVGLLFEMSEYAESSPEYKEAADKLKLLDEKGSSIRTGQGVFNIVSNPRLLSLSVDYIKSRFEQKLIDVTQKLEEIENIKDKNAQQRSESSALTFQKTLLEKIIKPGNFGKLSDLNKDERLIGEELTAKSLVENFLKNYSELVLKKVEYEDYYENLALTEDKYVPEWDRTGNEQLFDELIDGQTLSLLSSIQQYSEQGKGVPQLNGLGFKKILPTKNVIAKVAKLLRNTPDAMAMSRKIKDAAKTDKEIDQLFRRLGDISEVDFTEGLTVAEHKQWSGFWESFNKADVLLREFILEKEIDDTDPDNPVITLTSKSGKSSSMSLQVTRQWSANFKFKLNEGDYTDEVDGVSLFNLEKLYESYNLENNKSYAKIQGPGVNNVTSKTDRNRSATSEYTLTLMPEALAKPFEFLSELGIDLVEDEDVRRILFKGDSELGIDPGIIRFINDSIKNRMKQVIWDSTLEKWIVNPNAKYIGSLDQLFKGFTYFDAKGEIQKQPSLFGYLKQLRELQYIYSNDYTNFSSFNANGDLQSEKSYNSSLLVSVAAINGAKNLTEFLAIRGMEHLDPYVNPQAASSKWLIDMFQLDPSVHAPSKRGNRDWGIKINVENLSGSKLIQKYKGVVEKEDDVTGEMYEEKINWESDKGVESMGSDAKTKFITDFHLTLEGKQEIMRSEAKSTSLTAYAASRKGSETRKGINLLINKNEVVTIFSEKYKGKILYNEFKNHIAAEIIRIQRIGQLKTMLLSGEINSNDIAIDVKQLNRGEDWFTFDKIFTPSLKEALLAVPLDGVLADKGFAIDVLSNELKTEIEKQLVEYFRDEAQLLMKEQENKLIISDNLYEEYANENEPESSVKDKMFRTFLINNFIQNLNYNSLFLGDPTVFNVEGEDFHKRIAGLISTGKIFRHDDVWLSFINSQKFNSRGFGKKHNSAKGISKDYSYNGYLTTAIIKEATSNSVYAEHYKKLLGIDTRKYKNEDPTKDGAMEEADGAGWISFDAYRILNFSINEWSDAQENAYQKMLNGEKLSKNDIATTFPARKFQYFGNVSNPQTETILGKMGLSIPNLAFHKYSLVPLIPGLIEDTPLQDLHEKMMEQGVDYVTMQSGSKLSSLSKVKVDKTTNTFEADIDNFYDAKTRSVNEDTAFTFTPNVIHVKYLKSQIFLAEGYKGHITLPTQLRKIATIGVMDGGVPTDYIYKGKKNKKQVWDALSEQKKKDASKKYTWLKEFNNTLDTMEDVLKNQLLEDIELKEVVVNGEKQYTGDSSKLKQYLQDKLKSKEILPAEIESITNPDGTLIDDLSLSLLSEQLEEILVNLVDKTLRRIVVNGEALVQVTGAMYENKFSKASPEQELEHGSNGLKFYFLKDANGKPVVDLNGNPQVQAMEVKISLQGDFKKLLYTTHPDNNSVSVFFKNEEGRNELDYTASLKRLNEAIKDTAWLAKYEKFISIPGVRIPTQGPNALVSATVAEFLPEWAGPIIILPSEITAQTGSDFDIDKLFNMFKNLILLNGNVEEIAYNPNVTESYNELRDMLKPIDERIKDASKELTNAWEEYTGYLESKTQLNTDVASNYETLTEVQAQIDEKYSQKKEIADNKLYPRDLQRKLHADLQVEIDALNSSVNYLRGVIKNKLSDFFNTEINNKKDREEAVQAIHDEYMSKIKDIENKINSINDEKAEIEKKIAGKGVKGLENKLFDLLSERVLMPDNLALLVTPNTVETVEPLARNARDKIKKSYSKTANKKNSTSAAGKISKTSIFEYRYNLLKHQENSVGKDSLGIAAISATFYAIFTTYGATLQNTSNEDQTRFEDALKVLQNEALVNTPAYTRAIKTVDNFRNKKLKFVKDNGEIGYNLNEEDNAVTLGIMKNADGQQISDIISQLINGYVDVAKDAWIFDAQGTKENTPILLFMVMSGISTDSVINMVNNPLVLEYNELKKEFDGVFAKAGKDSTDVSVDDKISASMAVIYERYKALFSSKAPGNKTKTTIFNHYRIGNAADPFNNTELEQRLGQEPTFRDVEILSHYIQIEQMANQLTAFTMLSKFDTTKISNITEAQKRIEDIEEFKLTKIEDKLIPDSWFVAIQDTPIGKFNNDKFIVDLFSKYFKIKNNKALVLRSLGIKAPAGTDAKKVLTEFKNDFMWFLYQNAAYSRKSYTTSASKYFTDGSAYPGKSYTLIEDPSLTEAMEVNEETGEVKYHPTAMVKENNMTEFMYSSKFFNADLPKEWVAFRLEYNNLKQASEVLSDDEFKEKFYQFDNPNNSFLDNGSAIGRSIILQRAALYNTNNVNAMFDLSVGIGNILRNFTAKYPGLKTEFALIRDIQYDFNEPLKKMNIYFPQIKDSQMAMVYRENAEKLKNYPEREIAEFFGKLSHLAIMQSGMNRKSKYDFSKITDQNLFSQVIQSEIGLVYINDVLQELEASFENREGRKDGQIVDQFKDMFTAKLKNNGLLNKVRGTNYLVNELRFSKVKKLAETNTSQNKINILPLNKTLTVGQELLQPAFFFNNPNMTAIEFADSIKNMNWVIRNEKLIAPEGKSQKELDKALLVLGIDNSGDLPVLKYISKNTKKGFLSIGTSEVQKARYVIKDEAMANSATKAIGKATDAFNPKYQSSSAAYANAIENTSPNKLAKAKSTKEQFVATDKVWIFGSTITQNAYLGRKKEEFIANVEKTFSVYHKPLIDKAIEAGVKNFFVGTASGIDKMASDYLQTKGYVPVLRYSELGTYNEFVSAADLEKTTGQNFSPAQPQLITSTYTVFNTLLDALYENTERYTPKWFTDLTASELVLNGKNIVKERILKTIGDIDNNYNSNNSSGFRSQLAIELRSSSANRISIGNTLFDSIVEEILMSFRTDIISKKPKTISTTQSPAGIIEKTDKIILRNELKANPTTLYLFGDNDIRKGLGGQAKEMRGEPNAIGVSTKKLPARGEEAYKSDNELQENKKIITDDINKAIAEWNTGKYSKLVIPQMGVGLAELPTRAPKTYKFLQEELKRLEDVVTQSTSSKNALAIPGTSDFSTVTSVSPDYGVVQVETNPSTDRIQYFLDLIKPQIKKQTYKENIGKAANQMFHFGKMWSRVTAKAKPIKINSFASTANRDALIAAGLDAKNNPMGISEYTYAYHELDQNGNPLPAMSELQPIIDEIQKALGIDMSNYDSVIGNIYQPNEYIYPHKDVTESKSARNYPVIVYTLGANAGLGIVDNNQGQMTFANQYDAKYLRGNEALSGYTNEVNTKNGSIYTFGMGGKGRFELTHSTPINDSKFNAQPPITLPNGKVITNYTITLTFRRAADLEPGMPVEPAKLNNLKNVTPALTFNLLPFSAEQKQNILTNFTRKYFSGKNESVAREHIDQALAKANPQKQAEIIELLKACYK